MVDVKSESLELFQTEKSSDCLNIPLDVLPATSGIVQFISVTGQCSTVQYSAVQCSTVQYSAVQYSAVQCSAVQCSAVW